MQHLLYDWWDRFLGINTSGYLPPHVFFGSVGCINKGCGSKEFTKIETQSPVFEFGCNDCETMYTITEEGIVNSKDLFDITDAKDIDLQPTEALTDKQG